MQETVTSETIFCDFLVGKHQGGRWEPQKFVKCLALRLTQKRWSERASERAKKREEGCGNISSCCTGSSGPIDVSTACTRALSTSYQHRWAARSVLQQEKIHDNCKALVVLPPTHFSQTLTFSKSFLTSETIPVLGFIKSNSGKTKVRIRFVWRNFCRTSTADFSRLCICFHSGLAVVRVHFLTVPDHTEHTAHLLLHNGNCLSQNCNNYKEILPHFLPFAWFLTSFYPLVARKNESRLFLLVTGFYRQLWKGLSTFCFLGWSWESMAD